MNQTVDTPRYILTEESRIFKDVYGNEHTCYRIQATMDFNKWGRTGNVRKGQLGGFVESEKNLNPNRHCGAWIYNDAAVMGNAVVSDQAIVRDDATISGNATIVDYATVSGTSKVSDDAKVSDYAHISGNSLIVSNSKVYGDAVIISSNMYDNAKVDNECVVISTALTGNANILSKARVEGCRVTDNGTISGSSFVYQSTISDNAKIRSSAIVMSATVIGDSIIGGYTYINNDKKAHSMCNDDINGRTVIKGNTFITDSEISNATISGDVTINESIIAESTKLYGNTESTKGRPYVSGHGTFDSCEIYVNTHIEGMTSAGNGAKLIDTVLNDNGMVDGGFLLINCEVTEKGSFINTSNNIVIKSNEKITEGYRYKLATANSNIFHIHKASANDMVTVNKLIDTVFKTTKCDIGDTISTSLQLMSNDGTAVDETIAFHLMSIDEDVDVLNVHRYNRTMSKGVTISIKYTDPIDMRIIGSNIPGSYVTSAFDFLKEISRDLKKYKIVDKNKEDNNG